MFAVDFDPSSRSHVVSGGEDNRAFVWKISDGSVKFLCDGKINLSIRLLRRTKPWFLTGFC